MITLIIPHYYNAERERNLERIVQNVRPQVDDAIIWNNDNPITPVEGARVIQSEHNIGCQGRFAAVKHLKDGMSHVLFHDNDVICRSPGFVQKMMKESALYPGDIITITGEYRIYNGNATVISRGQMELVPIGTLNAILQYWNPLDGSAKHDDVWFSVMAHHLGFQRRFLRLAWKNIKDHVGMWHTPGFFPERDQVFESLMAKGLPW